MYLLTKSLNFFLLMNWYLRIVYVSVDRGKALQNTATHCNTLQHTATHCNPYGIFLFFFVDELVSADSASIWE